MGLSSPRALSGTEGSTGGRRRGPRLGEDERKERYLTGGSRSSVRNGEGDRVLGSVALAWAGPRGERRERGGVGLVGKLARVGEKERGEGVGQKGSPSFLCPFLFPFSLPLFISSHYTYFSFSILGFAYTTLLLKSNRVII